MTSKMRAEEQENDVLSRLKDIEQRLDLLENMVGYTRKICKVCDTTIDIRNTSREALLAELCDRCWKMLSEEQAK